MARKNNSRRTKRPAEEGYQWARGGRCQVKDLTHPMWKSDTSSDDDPDISRITAHTDNGNKHSRDEVATEENGNKRLKTSSPLLREKIHNWTNKIRVDMTCKEFGKHLLDIAREVIQSDDYLRTTVESMCEELGIPFGLPKVLIQQPEPLPQAKHPKSLKAVDTPGNCGWDSNAYFTSKIDGETPLSYTAATSAKSRDVSRFQDIVKVCGTVSHATVALHHYVTRCEPQIGVNLGLVRDPDEKAAVGADLLLQIKTFLHSPRVFHKGTNDAISLQKTLFSVIIPPTPGANSTNEENSNHKRTLRQIIKQLAINGSMKQRLIVASKEKRDLLDLDPQTIMDTPLIKVYRRKEHCSRVVTPEFLESFNAYLLTCEVTYDSPNRKDCVHAKDSDGNRIKDKLNGGYVLTRNRYYQRGLGWLYKHATRHVDDGGFVGFRNEEGLICVSQSTMERMMPHNYKRMTTTLKSSCRCASCLDAEYLHEDLMSWRNQHLKELQGVVTEQQNWFENNNECPASDTYQKKEQLLKESKVELENYKTDVFKFNEIGSLQQKVLSMEESLDLMTCGKVGDGEKFHQYKCCIGRCDKCPDLPINRGEEWMECDGIEILKEIIWRKHEHRHWCKIHGAIESGTCAECLRLPEQNRPIDKPRRTYDPVKKAAAIWEFLADHYSKYNLDQFRQHNFLRRALGKNWCKRLRDPYVLFLLELHRQDVHTIWDFADRMACEYNNATMTEGMGGSAKNIGMEGCCYHMLDDLLGCVQRHWFGFLSDEKQQDARTCFVNRCKFIEEMQKQGKLTEGSTLWIQTDGCGKQYKCHNFMQMHILLAKMYKIKIDVMITTAGHGKCLVDSLAGTDKHLLDNGRISEMDSTRVDEHLRAKSEAHKACIFLGSVDRMLGSYKHTRQTEDQFEVKSRRYSVSNYDHTKTEVEARDIPFKNTNFGAVSGWKSGKKNGIKEMFHFRFDNRIVGNIGMARRIPCACVHCTKVLDSPWVGLNRNPEIAGNQKDPVRIHPRDQPSYKQPPDCVFRPMMMDGDEDLNAWHFVEIAPMKNKCKDEELDHFFSTAMEARVKVIETEIVLGGIVALSAATDRKEHGFHLVEWTKKPHTLQASAKVFGLRDRIAPGQVVCEGVFWSRVDHSNDWYEPQENKPWRRPKKVLFLLSQVLCGKVCFKKYLAGIIFPPSAARVSKHNKSNRHNLIRLGADEIDFLQQEQLQREGFELTALDKIEKNRPPTNKKKGRKDSSAKGRGDDDLEEDDEYVDDTWVHPDY